MEKQITTIPWFQIIVSPLFITLFLAWLSALRAWFDNVWDEKGASDRDWANLIYTVFLTFLIGIIIYFLFKAHKSGLI